MNTIARSAVTLAGYGVVNLSLAAFWHLVLFEETLAAATPFSLPMPLLASFAALGLLVALRHKEDP